MAFDTIVLELFRGVGEEGSFSLQFIFKFSPFFISLVLVGFSCFCPASICLCICVCLCVCVQTFVICACSSSSKGSFSGSESVVSE